MPASLILVAAKFVIKMQLSHFGFVGKEHFILADGCLQMSDKCHIIHLNSPNTPRMRSN